MFGFLERKNEKRIFFNYLMPFGLTPYNLNPHAVRLILDSIYHEANDVAQRFNEPVSTVSRNIISAAAWGSIYCLMGPSRMIELEPEYGDITDEVEMELKMSCAGEEADHNIYHRVFTVLADYDLCHPEVTALIQQGPHCLSDGLPLEADCRKELN